MESTEHRLDVLVSGVAALSHIMGASVQCGALVGVDAINFAVAGFNLGYWSEQLLTRLLRPFLHALQHVS
jgi:hypothetical protein